MAHRLLNQFMNVKFRFQYPDLATAIDEVVEDNIAYLEKRALQELAATVRSIEEKKLEGAIVEAGCARGGSAITIAAAKKKERGFQVYDMFGTIPPPSDKDGKKSHERYKEIKDGQSNGLGDKVYYGYEEKLLDTVVNNFKRLGFKPEKERIEFIKGPFQNTMPELHAKLSLVHIDADWYESVMTALKYTEPLLVSGGSFIIDDYNTWSGCQRAVDEYFQDKKDNYKFSERSELHIIKENS